MRMRRRGRGLIGMAATTAVVAGTATVVSGSVARRQQQKAMAQQQQMAAQQAPAPAPAPAAAAPGEADYMAELEKLAELKEKGVITEDEFEAKKKQLLGI